jgi:CDP-glycerol glycerophosphotransferase
LNREVESANRIAKRSIKWLAWRIYAALPKLRIAVLSGYTQNDDTVLALEEGLRKTGLRKTVVLVPPGAQAPSGGLGPRTVAVKKYSFRGFAYFALAKYVFFTHSCHVHRFAPAVASVNVWHGMPVKRIGWMNQEGPLVPITRYTVATSPLWAEIMQGSLRPQAGVLVTGLPRNDRLLLGSRGVRERLGCEPGPPCKLIVWLPTFRGQWESGTHSLGVAADSLPALNRVLESHGAVAVVKPHPMAVRDRPPELSHFRFITDGWLEQQGLTLYELLGESDGLVTDVSSVYVDYLILDRPVVHHFPDVREYERSRGFSLSPIEDYLAGPLTRDAGELIDALSDILEGKDAYSARRRHVTVLFHTHLDGSATGRLLRELGLGPLVDPPSAGITFSPAA